MDSFGFGISTVHRSRALSARHQGNIYAVAFTPDGTRAVSSGFDRTLRLWDVTSGREVRSLVGHTDTVYALAASGDGKRILSGSWDGTARLWESTQARRSRASRITAAP